MEESLIELKNMYGKDTEFRDGQQETIQGVLEGSRWLVVKKQDWVYNSVTCTVFARPSQLKDR